MSLQPHHPTRSARRARFAVGVVLVTLLASFAPRGAAAGSEAAPSGAPDAKLTRIATMAAPISATPAGRRAGLLYVAEREGTIRILRPDGSTSGPVLDIRGLVSTTGEGGLLGVATGPSLDWLYFSYTGNDGSNRLAKARIRGNRSLGRSTRLLTVPHPDTNHHGGDVHVHDGHVYWSLGDGGGSYDTYGNGQNRNTLLGTIVRLKPNGDPVPSNPFVGRTGNDRIWIWGLRNPWRFSFDRRTGAMWIGDVGQGDREEVDRLGSRDQPGANLGWSCWEGTLKVADCTAPGHVPPVFEYGHDRGCSITGGYRYRGDRVPSLRRSYLYADYCNGTIRALVLGERGYVARSLGDDPGQVISFAEDATRELYVFAADGGVYRVDPS